MHLLRTRSRVVLLIVALLLVRTYVLATLHVLIIGCALGVPHSRLPALYFSPNLSSKLFTVTLFILTPTYYQVNSHLLYYIGKYLGNNILGESKPHEYVFETKNVIAKNHAQGTLY